MKASTSLPNVQEPTRSVPPHDSTSIDNSSGVSNYFSEKRRADDVSAYLFFYYLLSLSKESIVDLTTLTTPATRAVARDTPTNTTMAGRVKNPIMYQNITASPFVPAIPLAGRPAKPQSYRCSGNA